MKVTLTRNTIVNGVAAGEGTVVETSERDGRYLIAIGKAVEFTGKPRKEPSAQDANTASENDQELEAEKADARSGLISKAVPGGKRPKKKKKK